MKTIRSGWLVRYALLAAGLLFADLVSARVAVWSIQAFGSATDCDAQSRLKLVPCLRANVNSYNCSSSVARCNQDPGNFTTICQASAGGAACDRPGCMADNHDSLDPNDANGNPCTPTQGQY